MRGASGEGEVATGDGQTRSLADVAAELGVHYMTVYRWVRTGRLTARWVNGQWAVDAAALDQLVAEQRPDRVAGTPRWPRWRVRLERRLLAGDEPGAWELVESTLAGGASPIAVLLDLVAPVMVEVGRLWASGQITVADEHCASQVAARLVGRLGPRFDRPGRKRGAVVVGAPPGEQHSLPVAIAVDVLRWAGFRVIDLGVDLPAEALAATVARSDVLAVALGVTTPGRPEAVAEAVQAIRRRAEGVAVVVGGAALGSAEAAAAIGADAWSGTDARSLLAVVEDFDRRR
jgi:excisionase family DNA binding protein